MRIRVLLAAAGAAILLSNAAGAASINILGPGVLAPSGYAVESFDSTVQTPYGATTATGLISFGGATFTGAGVVMNNHGAGSDSLYATPFGDDTNYMAVLGGGQETISFGSAQNTFGLYWGSVDSYNSLTFYKNGLQVDQVTGSDTGPLFHDGSQGDFQANRYVLISGLASFDSVVIASSSNSFEFDNVTVGGVPEASTWAMMAMGFAGLGLAAFRPRTRVARAIS